MLVEITQRSRITLPDRITLSAQKWQVNAHKARKSRFPLDLTGTTCSSFKILYQEFADNQKPPLYSFSGCLKINFCLRTRISSTPGVLAETISPRDI